MNPYALKNWTAFAAGTLLLGTIGCGFLGEDTDSTADPLGDAVDAALEDRGTDGVAATAVTDLQPHFGRIGSEDVAPRRLMVRFDRDVIEPDQTGPILGDTTLRLTPEVKGSWTWESPDRIYFTPEVGFAPSETYTVTVDSLQSQWGKLAGTPAEHVFETPDFEVSGVKRAMVTREHIDVDVVFTGPVDPSAARLVKLTWSGKTLKPTVVESGRKNRLRLRLKRATLPEGVFDLQVRISAGAVNLVDGTTKAGAASRVLALDTTVKPMEIRNARMKEAADGWYLEVLCHDAAVGDEDYWWDRETYDSWYLSERCVLAPDSLTSLRITPEVEGMYIAEGQRGFRVFGTFPRGPLKVELAAGAFTEDGGVLEKAWSGDFEVTERTPRVDLLAKQGRYLPRGAWSNLPIQHLNTNKVDVQVRHVPAENLVFWLSDDDESATERTSDVVAEKVVAVKNSRDQVQASWIDVGAMVTGDTRGLFEIRVSPKLDEPKTTQIENTVDTGFMERRTQSTSTPKGDVSRIVLTDMQLVVKAEETRSGQSWPDRITVWALDSDDSSAVPGADVTVVRPSGFVMANCRTSLDGSCELDMPVGDHVDETPPLAVVVRKGDDLTYLKFADLELAVSEQRVAGVPWMRKSPYKASVYADRGVYRPGDTVHFGLVLRSGDNVAPDKQIPAVLHLKDPRRKLAKKVTLTTNDAGMATFDFRLAAFAPTGSWRAVVEIGDEIVGELPFAVEEFVPERMKVEATLRGDGMLASESGKVDVSARYLFGGSAEGSPVEVNCSIRPGRFTPKSNHHLHYGAVFVGNDKTPREAQVSSTKVALDSEGAISADCGGLSEGYPVTGTLIADVAVFEAGSGRATRGSASVPVHPETYYIGLDTGVTKAGAGDKIPMKGLVVDWSGKARAGAGPIEVVVYRLEEEYGWWWWDDRGEQSYDLYLRRVEEQRLSVSPAADGSFDFTVTPKGQGAGYLVRATSGGARTDFRIDGERRRYSWSGSNHVDRTPRPAKATSIDVTLPEEIAVGEQVRAVIDVPFDGRVLMTLETHELLTYEWVDVKAGQAEWPFTVKTFVPNVYVSAFLVKDPHLDSPEGYTPERAFGVATVRVSPEAYRLAVKLDVPDEVRSNSPLTVQLDLGAANKNSWLTVAAVDEGILQLTKFESPNPLKDVFPTHQLGVKTYETVGWSILMPAGTSSSHGGDEGGGAGRVQPVKPVALWSGMVQTDDLGKATVTLDVPQYRGALRVMAVAASAERLGSASEQVLVRDPLVLQTTLPRFLIQGDTLQVPVFVTNMSGKDRTITVSMTADYLPWPGMPDDPNAPSPVSFLGAKTAAIEVANGKSKTVAFQVRADALVGAATFRVKVESDGLASYEELEVPFAPSGPKSRVVKQIALTDGVLDLGPHLAGWLPTTEQSTFWVTPNPYGQAMGHLKHLVRYPHGCIEQTTSSTRPLLFVSNLVPAILPEVHGDELEKMVMHGVDRVLSMQTASGGFGYWPGARRPEAWGTAYATHMLIDAKALQYDVPQDRIDDALDYLEEVVRQSEGKSRSFSTYRYSEPYTHYVLAQGGRAKKARIQALLGQLPSGSKAKGEDHEARYLLQAALYLAGDRRYEAELRKPDVSKLTGERKNSWTFYSDLRRRGFTLSVYQDLFGADATGAEDLAQLVARGLESKQSSYYTTQELVWGITGLGKRVATGSQDFKNVSLKADGKKLDAMAFKNAGSKRHDSMWAVPRASERSLTLNVGDMGSGKLFLILSSEGVRTEATYKTGGKGLALTREYLNAEGKPVNLGNVALGDVVYTRLTVKNTTKEKVQNLALVDRFVAGWEIENPRLGRSGVVDWVVPSEAWSADYMNLRDDRLELFGSLDAGQSRTVVYGLRAVTAGEFTSPPVEMEAMYDPTIWARQPGSKVTIKGPWADVLL